jgi:ZIP family zinc transporter
MDDPLIAILLTFIAGMATSIGAILGILNKKPAPRFQSFILAFSAGVMIYLSFNELYNQAQHLLGIPIALLFLVAGIGLALFLDLVLPENDNVHDHMINTKKNGHYQHRWGQRRNDEKVTHQNIGMNAPTFSSWVQQSDPEQNAQQDLKVKSEQQPNGKPEKCEMLFCIDDSKSGKIGLLAMIAIFIHNIPEGLATFSASLIDIHLGVQIMFAIMLHNIPEGITVAVPIYTSTKSRKKAFWYATFSGMAEPIGALLAWAILSVYLTTEVLMGLFAFVAGIMIYISVDVLLPTAKSMEYKHTSVIGFTLGMIVLGISLIFI